MPAVRKDTNLATLTCAVRVMMKRFPPEFD